MRDDHGIGVVEWRDMAREWHSATSTRLNNTAIAIYNLGFKLMDSSPIKQLTPSPYLDVAIEKHIALTAFRGGCRIPDLSAAAQGGHAVADIASGSRSISRLAGLYY